jgi:hypothetical protein
MWLRLNGAINQHDSGAQDVVFSSSSVSCFSDIRSVPDAVLRI